MSIEVIDARKPKSRYTQATLPLKRDAMGSSDSEDMSIEVIGRMSTANNKRLAAERKCSYTCCLNVLLGFINCRLICLTVLCILEVLKSLACEENAWRLQIGNTGCCSERDVDKPEPDTYLSDSTIDFWIKA
jgi:hypothetical protein